MDRVLKLDIEDAPLAPHFDSLYLEGVPSPFTSCVPVLERLTHKPSTFDKPRREGDLMLDSSPSDTSAVNREIRAHFEYLAKMKRDIAKRERESNKPKRPLSAYNLFFKAEREKILKEKRKPGFSDLAKEIATKWKALDAEDRKQFDEEVLRERRRYNAAFSQWKAQAKLDLKKSMAYQGQHTMPLGKRVSTSASFVDQNEPDPTLLRNLSVQHHLLEEQHMRQHQLQMHQKAALSVGPCPLHQTRAVEEQQIREAQLKNAALVARSRRMSMPSATASTVEGSKDSKQSAPLPMSLQCSIEDHFSSCNMTTYHQGLSLSTVPPLSSIESEKFDPVDFLEPHAFGDSSCEGAVLDPELANAIMNIPLLSNIDSTEDERDETFYAMISCMVEPTPIRRSSFLPCESSDSQRVGVLQSRPSSSMPICGVAEMNELQGAIQLLKNAGATEKEW